MATERDLGGPRPDELRELLELTEQALEVGLDAAVAAARAAIAARLGDRAHEPAVDGAFEIAIASAARALAARDVEAATVDELRSMASIDELTGVLNRRAFFARLDDALVRAQRGADRVTFVLCDIDQLKRINDGQGHPAGDIALREFAARLASNIRASDCVGRIGGDEFGVLLLGADATGAEPLLTRLCEAQSGATDVSGVRASFGSAQAPDEGTTRDELIAVADRRLYQHKQARAAGIEPGNPAPPD